MSEDLTLGSVRGQVDDDAIVINIELTNSSDRTLHAYRDARRVLYDPATGILRVGLTDRGSDATGNASSFVLPDLTSVDPHGSTTIEVRLPRVLTQIGGVTAQGAPVIERVPIDEATEVAVDVGWSDTPFYADARPSRPEAAHPAAQLRAWERGLATGRAPLTRPAAG